MVQCETNYDGMYMSQECSARHVWGSEWSAFDGHTLDKYSNKEFRGHSMQINHNSLSTL